MPKSKFSEAQIVAALRQVEAGRAAADVAREVGVTVHTIYAWKAKYGGMDVSEAQEARQLREENARLRKLVADLSLDKDALKSVIAKKRVELGEMKAPVEHLQKTFAFSQRRACGFASTKAVGRVKTIPKRFATMLPTSLSTGNVNRFFCELSAGVYENYWRDRPSR